MLVVSLCALGRRRSVWRGLLSTVGGEMAMLSRPECRPGGPTQNLPQAVSLALISAVSIFPILCESHIFLCIHVTKVIRREALGLRPLVCGMLSFTQPTVLHPPLL